MKFNLQHFVIPNQCKVLKNSFSTYDPEIEYTEEKNLFYLSEDLLQIEVGNLIIDLGWYGEIWNNNGQFKIFVIKNQDWENPIQTESSKSQRTIRETLENILASFKNHNL